MSNTIVCLPRTAELQWYVEPCPSTKTHRLIIKCGKHEYAIYGVGFGKFENDDWENPAVDMKTGRWVLLKGHSLTRWTPEPCGDGI